MDVAEIQVLRAAADRAAAAASAPAAAADRPTAKLKLPRRSKREDAAAAGAFVVEARGPKGARGERAVHREGQRRGTTRKITFAKARFRLSTPTGGRPRGGQGVDARTLRRITRRKLRVTVTVRAAGQRRARSCPERPQPAEAAAPALAAPQLEPDLGGAVLVLGAPAVGQALDEEEPPAASGRRAGRRCWRGRSPGPSSVTSVQTEDGPTSTRSRRVSACACFTLLVTSSVTSSRSVSMSGGSMSARSRASARARWRRRRGRRRAAGSASRRRQAGRPSRLMAATWPSPRSAS